jgi:glycerol-3-phosphate O-acyltransferase/dihydroxyacetone phosphate acyltransferase
MFYAFLKRLVGFALRIFYRKIYVTGTEYIKSDRPQLLASNHPNGFMEPLVMACHFSRPLHFLVRGDVFDKKWLRPLLISTNQIPIFRFRDGFSKLRENAATMDESTKVLCDNNLLLIYAEGSTSSIRQLRPLQKGLARIAFSVLEADPNTILEILPSGVIFSHPTHFGRDVHLSVGAPIFIRDYAELYALDPKAAYQKLLDDIYSAMRPHVVHLDNTNDTHLLENLMSISRINHQFSYLPVVNQSRDLLNQYINTANQINTQENYKREVETQVKEVESMVKKQGYTLDCLCKTPLSLKRMLFVLIGFIPALLGLIFNFIPVLVGKLFANAKVNQKEFYACIWMAVTIVFFLLYYVILSALIISFGWKWYVIPIFLLSGLWLRYYYDVFHHTVFNIKPSQWHSSQQKALNILNIFK